MTHQIIHIVISIALIICVLSQAQGSGLSGAIGGTDTGVVFAKRGVDKILQNLTFVFALLFTASSIWFIFS